jgi:hypothetical protein
MLKCRWERSQEKFHSSYSDSMNPWWTRTRRVISSSYLKLYLTSLNLDSACDFRCVGTRSGWDSITILLYAAFTCITKMQSSTVETKNPEAYRTILLNRPFWPNSNRISSEIGAAEQLRMNQSRSFGSSERDGNQGRTSEGDGRE